MSQLTDWSFLPSFPPPQGATELEGVAWGRQWGSCCSGTEVACFPLSKPVCQAAHVPRRVDSRWRLPRMTRRTPSWWSMLSHDGSFIILTSWDFFLNVLTKQQKLKQILLSTNVESAGVERFEAGGSLSLTCQSYIMRACLKTKTKWNNLLQAFPHTWPLNWLMTIFIFTEILELDTLIPGYWSQSVFSGFKLEVLWESKCPTVPKWFWDPHRPCSVYFVWQEGSGIKFWRAVH